MVDVPPENKFAPKMKKRVHSDGIPHGPEDDDFEGLCDQYRVDPKVKEYLINTTTPGERDVVIGMVTSENPEIKVEGLKIIGIQPTPDELKKAEEHKEKREHEIALLLGAGAMALSPSMKKKEKEEKEEEEDAFVLRTRAALHNKPRADTPSRGLGGRGALFSALTGPTD
ncbi:MAG: hypothetical protein PHW76_03070 [Alphaproteobacteria bacterium]|nr:hypothetical protein [Alphaproteobacteria bacterium]